MAEHAPDSPLRWFDVTELTETEVALVEAVRRRLAAETALTARELAQHPDVRRHAAAILGVDEPLDVDETWSLLDEMLEHVDAGFGWLGDERNFLPKVLCSGTTVTLRVTEELLTDHDVHDGPDVALLALTERRSFPLADGGEAARVIRSEDDFPDIEAHRFVLPPDALADQAAPGDLLALSWDGSQLAVGLVDEPPPQEFEQAAAALRASFDHLMQEGLLAGEETVESHDLLGVARIDHGLFDDPLPPVTELIRTAGLSCHGDHVGVAEHDWDAWQDDRRATAAVFSLGSRYGLGPQETKVLLRLLAAVERELAAIDEDAAVALDRADNGPSADDELGLLLAACSHEQMADALASAGAYEEPELAPGLLALAQRMLGVARGGGKAVAHHLAAAAAEAAGDAERAARHASLAARADPQRATRRAPAARDASTRSAVGRPTAGPSPNAANGCSPSCVTTSPGRCAAARCRRLPRSCRAR